MGRRFLEDALTFRTISSGENGLTKFNQCERLHITKRLDAYPSLQVLCSGCHDVHDKGRLLSDWAMAEEEDGKGLY